MDIWAFPSFYPMERDGMRWTGIFAHRQYKGLIENGANLKVVLPVLKTMPFPISKLSKKWSESVKYPEERVFDGITVYHPRIDNILPYAIDKRNYREKFFGSLDNFFRRKKIELKPGKDIFYSQWLPNSAHVQYAAHKFGIKSAILAIGDDVVVWPPTNSATMNDFRQLIELADFRFTCADFLGKEINNMLKADFPYEVINWGVDHRYFKPGTDEEKQKGREKYGLPAQKVLILNVGSSIVRKGWLDLFDASMNLRKKLDNFAIVGVNAGHPDIDLDVEAEKRGLKDVFFNIKEVHPDVLNEVFNAVDIFCLPSHWEGLANANIEAMSSGLPVITTNVCGHPELIKSNETGILIPPKQPAVLEEALYKLITDLEFRKFLGTNARNFIVNEWGDFRKNSEKLLQLLSS